MARSRDPEAFYALAESHTQTDPAAAAALARYKSQYPEDTGATVLVPGQEGYAGEATLDPQADVYVKSRPLTDSRLKAQVEAERLIPATDAAGREQSLMQGVLLNGADELGGRLQQGGQMVRNLGRRLQGEPVEINSSDLNDAFVDTYRSRQQQFARDKPFQAGGLQLAGGLLTGGATFGSGIAGAAATGAAYGAGAGGLGAEGSFADRLPQAAIGGAVGGALGAGAQAVVPRLASIANAGVRRVIPARQSVAERFAPVIDDAAYAERSRLQDLGLRPTVMDVLPQRAERLVRTAAGPAGPGAEMAVTRSRDLTQNLKPDIMSDTRALNGDPRTATQVREGLLDTRSRLADEMYPEAYATPVPVSDELLSALGDAPGRAALTRARQAAVARRRYDQVDEIDRLLSASPRLDTSQEAIAARARQEGFNIDAYHGTPSTEGFDSLNPSSTGTFGPGIYASRSPQTANQYAAAGSEAGGTVYPVRMRINNPAEASAVRNPFSEMSDDQIRAQLSSEGRGGVVANMGDDQWYVASSPADVRSRFDAFTPEGYVAPPETVSAGTLDRTRIAMGNRAEALSRNATGARDIAGGLNSRAGDINAALESVPALAPARETYANLSGAVDALDNAAEVFSMPPDDFAQIVQNLTPEQRQASIIGVRQEIMDTLGGQKAAGTGTLDRIAQAPYARQNLAMLLGEDESARYLAQIDARVQQTQRAARVSPNTNSQTFGRGLDEETFNAANMVGTAVDGVRAARGDPMAFGRTLDKLRARATMSPADREAIVAMGFDDADQLENIVRLAQEAQQAGRPVPRAVRAFIVDTRNVLGSQSPVPMQLERLLLPARVSAEEENQ